MELISDIFLTLVYVSLTFGQSFVAFVVTILYTQISCGEKLVGTLYQDAVKIRME